MSSGSGNRQTLSANGDTDARTYIGPVRVVFSGTFGGGTAKVQARDPSGAVVDVVNGSFSAVADKIFDFPAGESNVLSVNLAGSTSPAFVAWLQGKSINA